MSLSRLNLESNPFISIPPTTNYEGELRPLFSARSNEVEKICRLSESPTAIFVIAQYGGGKTVAVLEALARLRERGVITCYSPFDRSKGFRASLIEGISDIARRTGATPESAPETDSLRYARDTVRHVRSQGKKIVLAVDDLDRAGDLEEVFKVTHDVRDLLAEGASLIITGQPFGVTHDLHTSAGAIFHEVALPQFSHRDFREMLVRYLESARIRESASKDHPFSEDSADFLCREIAETKLTPRLFNFALHELIEIAVEREKEKVLLNFTLEHWPTLAERIIRGLTDLQSRHLRVIFGLGQISEDTHEAINELGGSKLAEYPEVKERILLPLLEKNLIQSQTREGKEFFSTTPHVAAAIGRILSDEEEANVPFVELRSALKKALEASEIQEKGESLEEFATLFLSSIPGFEIPADGMRLRTKHEELDVSIHVDSRLHTSYGVFTCCECKNWKAPVSWDELASFREKLTARSCRFGIFIALNGTTSGFRAKMNAYLREGTIIALLTHRELGRLRQSVSPDEILRDAFYATIKYEGEDHSG